MNKPRGYRHILSGILRNPPFVKLYVSKRLKGTIYFKKSEYQSLREQLSAWLHRYI